MIDAAEQLLSSSEEHFFFNFVLFMYKSLSKLLE